jgi:hypothetical protein
MPFAERTTIRKPWANDVNKGITLGATDLSPSAQAYTPTLSAVTTDPGMGTSNVRQARFMHLGFTVWVRYHLRFGTASVTAGSGIYFMDVPSGLPIATAEAATDEYSVIGIGTASDWSVGASRSLFRVTVHDSTHIRWAESELDETGAFVSNSTPWTWALDDRWGGSFVYETTVEAGFVT